MHIWQAVCSKIQSLQYMWILIQSNTWNIDSIQYLEYWCNPIPEILIQSNTWNIDSIQYLKYWCNLPGPSAANRNESNWALESTENMAGEGELDLEVEFPKFLADILDKTEIIFENFDSEVSEVHAEVLDQTISLLR